MKEVYGHLQLVDNNESSSLLSNAEPTLFTGNDLQPSEKAAEDAIHVLEQRGESLESHMQRGGIEQCPVMGQMAESSRQFIVDRVVEHAEKAVAFKGMSMADILAKKQQKDPTPTPVTDHETRKGLPQVQSKVNIMEEVYAANQTVALHAGLETTRSKEIVPNQKAIELPLSESVTARLETHSSAEAKHRYSSSVTAEDKITPAIVAPVSTESTRAPLHEAELRQQTTTAEVATIAPTVMEHEDPWWDAVEDTAEISQTLVSNRMSTESREIREPEVAKPIAREDTAIEPEIESPNQHASEFSDYLISADITHPQIDAIPQDKILLDTYSENNNLLIAEDVFTEATRTIEHPVEAAITHLHEALVESVSTEKEAEELQLFIEVLQTEVVPYIGTLSEVPATTEELARLLIETATDKTSILEFFGEAAILPHIEQLADAMLADFKKGSYSVDVLNSNGTYEHKFYALWRSKGLGDHIGRYQRISRYILGSAKAAV